VNSTPADKDADDRVRDRLIAKELQLALSSNGRTVRFHGESMRPFLREGDRVVVEPVEWETIRVGDVVTYRFEDKFPTRRVVGIRENHLELWCDNWVWLRFEASRQDVLGRVTARKRANEPWVRRTEAPWRRSTRDALAAYRRERLRRLKVRIRGGLARRARRAARGVHRHGA